MSELAAMAVAEALRSIYTILLAAEADHDPQRLPQVEDALLALGEHIATMDQMDLLLEVRASSEKGLRPPAAEPADAAAEARSQALVALELLARSFFGVPDETTH